MNVIELGSRGFYARAVQRIVNVPASKVDGVIGPFSVALIEAWQGRRGVDPDGVFGPVSRAAVEPGDLIKPYEGLVLQAYDDAHGPLKDRLLHREGQVWRRADRALLMGYPTIGWGRRLWPGEWIETCTKAQADQWFLEFLKERLGDTMARHFPSGKDAACKAATLSLGYNAGPGGIVDCAAAGFAADWWTTHKITSKNVRDAGLVMRRAEESALYWGEG